MDETLTNRRREKARAIGFVLVVIVAVPWMAFWGVQAVVHMTGAVGREAVLASLLLTVGAYAVGVWVAARIGLWLGLRFTTFLAIPGSADRVVILRYSLLASFVSLGLALLPYLLHSVERAAPAAHEPGSLDGLLTLLVVGLAIPIIEEVVFRGIALSLLREISSQSFAVALTSLLWVLMHPDKTLLLFALGAFYAFITFRTRSLIPAIFGHVTLNVVTIVAA